MFQLIRELTVGDLASPDVKMRPSMPAHEQHEAGYGPDKSVNFVGSTKYRAEGNNTEQESNSTEQESNSTCVLLRIDSSR
jgi:hypothetical protein